MPQTHRFFVEPNCIRKDHVLLKGPVSWQISRVLRAKIGQEVVVLDNSGWEYSVILEKVMDGEVLGVISGKNVTDGEPDVLLTLYQAVLKADRFEYVLQKGTELGVSKFVPLVCERSIPRIGGNSKSTERDKRWRRIILEAAEQSNRSRLPVLSQSQPFRMATESVSGPAMILWERELDMSIHLFLSEKLNQSSKEINIFTGPEGGFTMEEVRNAEMNAVEPVTLGKRILRSETAAIASISVAMYHVGELG